MVTPLVPMLVTFEEVTVRSLADSSMVAAVPPSRSAMAMPRIQPGGVLAAPRQAIGQRRVSACYESTGEERDEKVEGPVVKAVEAQLRTRLGVEGIEQGPHE